MKFNTIQLELRGTLAIVTLNRPKVRNALNEEMLQELTHCFHTLAQNNHLRVVVLRGQGDVFCAGADIHWMQKSIDLSWNENHQDARKLADMLDTLNRCPIPVIASVHKAAFGGGIGLIAACDIVIATHSTQFCFAEVRLGIIPAVISTFALNKMGMAAARRYFLTGEVFNSETALRIGLIHEAVAENALNVRIAEILNSFANVSPQAVREAKRLLRIWPTLPPSERIPFCVDAITNIRVTPEAQEGLRAFLEKRKPSFTIEEPPTYP